MDFPFEDAKQQIDQLIATYQSSVGPDDECPIDTTKGRMYELVVLGHLIDHLVKRGFSFRFVGKVLELKEKPSQIKATDAYFEGTHHRTGRMIKVYTDVEVRGLGCVIGGATDLSSYHEVDLVVVDPSTSGRPDPGEVLLGVECKSGAFGKSIIKEVLGVKRELSLLAHDRPSALSQISSGSVMVPSKPAIEFWLAHFDPKGQQYQDGPAFFGIDVKLITP
jgi:hypothetical protein